MTILELPGVIHTNLITPKGTSTISQSQVSELRREEILAYPAMVNTCQPGTRNRNCYLMEPENLISFQGISVYFKTLKKREMPQNSPAVWESNWLGNANLFASKCPDSSAENTAHFWSWGSSLPWSHKEIEAKRDGS